MNNTLTNSNNNNNITQNSCQNNYFQHLGVSNSSLLFPTAPKVEPTVVTAHQVVEDQTAAKSISFFNTDHLIKFASGLESPKKDSDNLKINTNASSANGEQTTFEFKLNDEFIKDMQFSNLSEKKLDGNDDLVIMSLIKVRYGLC
jgi:hypothetical protein